MSLSPNMSKFPTKILYPTEFFPVQEPAQQKMVESFVEILESFLGVKKTSFSLAETWAQSPPAEAEGKSLEDYAYTVRPPVLQFTLLYGAKL